MKTRIFSIGLVVLTTFAASQPSFAQQYGQPYQSFIDTLITNKVWEKSLKNYSSNSQPSGTDRSTSPDSAPVVRNTAVTPEQVKRAVQFKSTGTRLALDGYVDALGGTAQDKAETKERLIGLLDKFEAGATALGYPNDLPLALITFIAVNSAVKSNKPLLSNDQIVELRNIMAVELTKRGTLDGMTDQRKQRTYEFLSMDAGLLKFFYEKAKAERNAEDLKTCKLVAKHRLEIFGIEL